MDQNIDNLGYILMSSYVLSMSSSFLPNHVIKSVTMRSLHRHFNSHPSIHDHPGHGVWPTIPGSLTWRLSCSNPFSRPAPPRFPILVTLRSYTRRRWIRAAMGDVLAVRLSRHHMQISFSHNVWVQETAVCQASHPSSHRWRPQGMYICISFTLLLLINFSVPYDYLWPQIFSLYVYVIIFIFVTMQTFSIDRQTSKKCYTLSARELSIAFSRNALYWCWKPLLGSR